MKLYIFSIIFFIFFVMFIIKVTQPNKTITLNEYQSMTLEQKRQHVIRNSKDRDFAFIIKDLQDEEEILNKIK